MQCMVLYGMQCISWTHMDRMDKQINKKTMDGPFGPDGLTYLTVKSLQVQRNFCWRNTRLSVIASTGSTHNMKSILIIKYVPICTLFCV